MLPTSDWRWSIAAGDKIRYPMDELTLKTGTVREIEYRPNNIEADIRFTNGDYMRVLLKQIEQA